MVAAGISMGGCQVREKPNTPSSGFAGAQPLGRIDQTLAEASGLVASRANPGYLWTHNDSGDGARIFLIDQKGNIRFTCILLGATHRDWEDIAIGPGPDSLKTYLFIADVGDNRQQYAYKYIYYLEEPVLQGKAADTIRIWQRMTIRLEDGIRDCETLLADPVTRSLFLVSKREDSVHVYEIRSPFSADTLFATRQLTLPYHNITGGDISPDGREILLRTYAAVYYWARPAGYSLADALRMPATSLPYEPEPQGEAIAFRLDGTGYFTLSESPQENRAHLLFYTRN